MEAISKTQLNESLKYVRLWELFAYFDFMFTPNCLYGGLCLVEKLQVLPFFCRIYSRMCTYKNVIIKHAPAAINDIFVVVRVKNEL